MNEPASSRVAWSRSLRERRVLAALDRRFEAVAFDWDGTAVPDRLVDATRARALFNALLEAGFDLAVVTGTNVENVHRQLALAPNAPGKLIVACNRGSEVYELTADGPVALERRVANDEEEALLDRAAEETRARFAERGLEVAVVADRLNRRKIDLIPLDAWADPPKALLPELLAEVESQLAAGGIGGLLEAVEIARSCSCEVGLSDPRVTSDAKHVEIGLTDKTHSTRYVLSWLGGRGVRPAEIVIVGDEFGPLGGCPGSDSLMIVPEAAEATFFSVGPEPTGTPDGVLHLPGGPERFLDFLSDQLCRRIDGELPAQVRDEEWQVVIDGHGGREEAVRESILSFADGRIGTRGSLLPGSTDRRSVLVGGCYAGQSADEELLAAPIWARIAGARGEHVRRILDLRTGTLRHEISNSDGTRLEALLFASLARPGTVCLRAGGSDELLATDGPLVAPFQSGTTTEIKQHEHITLAESVNVDRVFAAAVEKREKNLLERLAAFGPNELEPIAALRAAEEEGFERLYAEQRERWGERWRNADVVIEGDPALQRAVRYSLFELMASVPDRGQAAVGAGGLSGPRYHGHVFWDADVFTLPFFAATHPDSAKAMLRYRLNRLEAARSAAQSQYRDGARFPWESTRSGCDVTPHFGRAPGGIVIPIRTGRNEEHITSDVAWAADCYLSWSGDASFENEARIIFVEAARYWASRIRVERSGAAHIYGVIGPDEYHEPVDDSAYTNVMARWTLRRAARAVREQTYPAVSDSEIERWLALADALVDGYDPETGIYEEFAGFYRLESLLATEIAERPFAAEAHLPIEYIRNSQIIKQADVVLLHHLVPDEVAEHSLEPNFAFYEPRTSHGSSLSPSAHALLLARLGAVEEALDYLRLSAEFDLEDRNETTAEGLHIATMGGVWQALSYGFAGLRPRRDDLELNPRLPRSWSALELTVRFRGARVRLRAEHERSLLWSEQSLRLVDSSGAVFELGPDGVEIPSGAVFRICAPTHPAPGTAVEQDSSLRRESD